MSARRNYRLREILRGPAQLPDKSAGFLPYGSSDASVLAQHDLMSLPSNASFAASSDQHDSDIESNPGDYFSALGFEPNANYGGGAPGTSGRLRFLFGSNLSAMTSGGQISFDVDIATLSANDAPSGSLGRTLSLQGQMIGAEWGSFDFNLLRRASGALATHLMQVGSTNVMTSPITGSTDNLLLHTKAHGDYARVQIGWEENGSDLDVIVAVDGLIVSRHTLTGQPGVNITTLRIGSADGGGNRMEGGYIKNFQMASTPPSVAYNAGKVVFFGDSMTNHQHDGSLGAGRPWTAQKALVFAQRLNQRGYYPEIVVQQHGGHYISDDGTAGFLLSDDVAAVNAANPRTVFIDGGTNDTQSWTTPIRNSFKSDYQSILDTLNAHSTIENIYPQHVRSFWGASGSGEDTAQLRANRDQGNALIDGLQGYTRVIRTYEAAAKDAVAAMDNYAYKGMYSSASLDDLHGGSGVGISDGIACAEAWLDSANPG